MEWNVDYPRETCDLDKVQPHGQLCGTKLQRYNTTSHHEITQPATTQHIALSHVICRAPTP